MYDVKNRRTFLRRTKYESLHLEDLYVGSKVTVFSRHLTIVDYGNLYTSRKLGSREERTLALIKPDGMRKMGQLFDIIINAGLTITKAKMMLLSRQFLSVKRAAENEQTHEDQKKIRRLCCRKEAADFYADYRAKPFYHELLQLIMSGPILAMELLGDDAVSKWRAIVGPANPTTTESDTLDSISESFGHCGLRDATHGPDSVALAAKELELFFPSSGGRGPVSSAKFTNCTCCIIKPHAVNEGLSGKIIKAILKEGFEISALQMFNMERPNVEEFYEIYKGVVPEYLEMVSELCSGPCIAMEIRQFDPSKVFRDFCGPSDPVLARHLRPGTLRAVFGKDKIQNAVHCTDLPEDGLLEVQYFFKILDK
ncbi:nucleoside diphosphate kinase 7 isoform X2 [Haemorhous mexicanus]|uniref:nucleoside diphosphate kinase 7 isoform X2 n=1 Tax=Haemorhous mexicanus TaxID=30427 RepID=UPI0028BF1A6F|nr:nucleoside diphosphate kinase 7 isoform X2 [Haemorhous mexicanus]